MDAATRQPASGPVLQGAAGIAIAVTVLGWASAFPAIRAGLHAFGPLELAALRFAIAALPAALFLLVTRPALPRPSEAWRFLAGGTFYVALYTVLLNKGEQTVSAGAASFIANVSPLITIILAMLVLGEAFGRRAWAGTALSFCGVGLIALSEGEALQIDTGALFVLAAAVCNAVSPILQKPLFDRHNPLTVSAWNMITGAVLLSAGLPSALSQASAAAPESLWAAIYLGIVPSLIAYATCAIALSRLPASRVSSMMYCIPPTATLIGFLWLGEVPSTLGAIGSALALAGVIFANTKSRR